MHNAGIASNFVEAQKTNLSSYKLTQAIWRSQKLNDFFKEQNTKINIPNIKAVLGHLSIFYNDNKNYFYPQINLIAVETGLSENSVSRILKLCIHSALIFKSKMDKDERRNLYCFTNKFWDLILQEDKKILKQKNISRGGVKKENTPHGEGYPYIYKQTTNILTNHEENFSKKNSFEAKTDFQKKYTDVFEKLSEYDLEKYKSLKGYEREQYLTQKRKELKQEEIFRAEREERERQKTGAGAPLDFTEDEAREYIRKMPAFVLQNSTFVKQLIKKWGFKVEEIRQDNTNNTVTTDKNTNRPFQTDRQ